MSANARLLAGVELGGTKCVCILGRGPDDIRSQERVPTGEPNETLARVEAILESWRTRHGALEAVGLASFGPLDLRRQSPTYGCITSTVKSGWSHTELVGRFHRRFAIPVGCNTDVNAAVLAEARWGASRELKDLAYVTVGTGIGVGLLVSGRTVLGCHHTEMGHIRISRLPNDCWPGTCAFHGDCVEGLASGPALEARSGVPASRIPSDHPVWNTAAHALAQLLHTIVLTTAPRRIFMGGGVLQSRPELFVRIRQEMQRSLADYLDLDELCGGLAAYVVPPDLGALAGPLGALALAADAAAMNATRGA